MPGCAEVRSLQHKDGGLPDNRSGSSLARIGDDDESWITSPMEALLVQILEQDPAVLHLGRPTRLLIGGRWRESSGGNTFATLDPSNGRPLTEVSEASDQDVTDAVAAAQTAMTDPTWTEMPRSDLAILLWRLADLIEADADNLARLETLDNGQPYGISRNVNIPGAVEHFRYFSGWATKHEGSTAPMRNPHVLHYTRHEPVGVCALITPWNFPLMITSWKLAPALACGNAVILKPAEQTPLTAVRLAELTVEAGFPPGVVNLITGGPAVGRALTLASGVDKVSFTGSTEVGREILRASAQDFRRVTLELGGKTPMVIAKDADIDSAVAGAVTGALFNSGQVCAAFSRFYVDKARADEFITKAAAAAGALRLGPGLDEHTEMGPLVTEEHLLRVHAAVRAGVAQGAELVVGGKRSEGDLSDGFFYQPTVFAGVLDSMSLVQEEIFGPVIPVLTYEDQDELIPRANDSQYGLAAAIWTNDLRTAHRLAAGIKAGAIFVNMLHVPDPAAPWGGFKSSGTGREMGKYALDAYTEVKGIFINLQGEAS